MASRRKLEDVLAALRRVHTRIRRSPRRRLRRWVFTGPTRASRVREAASTRDEPRLAKALAAGFG